MRIGLFTDSYPPYINGVSTRVYNLREALKKLGHTVYIVTVNDSIIKHEYDEKEKILRIPGIPIGIYDYRLSEIYSISTVKMIKNWNLDVILLPMCRCICNSFKLRNPRIDSNRSNGSRGCSNLYKWYGIYGYGT